MTHIIAPMCLEELMHSFQTMVCSAKHTSTSAFRFVVNDRVGELENRWNTGRVQDTLKITYHLFVFCPVVSEVSERLWYIFVENRKKIT